MNVTCLLIETVRVGMSLSTASKRKGLSLWANEYDFVSLSPLDLSKLSKRWAFFPGVESTSCRYLQPYLDSFSIESRVHLHAVFCLAHFLPQTEYSLDSFYHFWSSECPPNVDQRPLLFLSTKYFCSSLQYTIPVALIGYNQFKKGLLRVSLLRCSRPYFEHRHAIEWLYDLKIICSPLRSGLMPGYLWVIRWGNFLLY